jgi:uncharacterized protein DUF3990
MCSPRSSFSALLQQQSLIVNADVSRYLFCQQDNGLAMPTWLNKDLIVYHGTDDISVGAQSLPQGATLPMTINLTRCRPFTDFGQGFYVTASQHQAEQWANTRVLRIVAPTGPPPNAVVLSFTLGRDWLASLETLAFVRPIADFWDLVADCRTGFPPHQRLPPYNTCYDAVYGPVTLWPQRLVIQDCDQISFHTQRAVSGLNNPTVHRKAVGKAGGPGLF